ncbi:PREDICTED: uncharacterized protein LOC108663250 [Theobroma cacao]|uniref:Uncharacterized protein LOC108663250 n=1 Tax=Theobroma cacao TaxID=3641 RepID=A0AB32WS63_THECC|nr:PREDICTED: uncharacterized protein LOC108663250 [Theobroma cacao]
MRGVKSDLSFTCLMKLVEDVVGVNSEFDEIELLALISGTVECVMPLSSENRTIKDNNVRLEGDTAMLEDNTTFDEGNEDLFATGEDRFDDNSDDWLEEWHDDSAERFSFQTIATEESTGVDDRLYKERMFSLKAKLKPALNMLVIKEKFVIRVKRSCQGRYEVGCKDKACKFSFCGTKLPDRGEYWQVRTFQKVHTCTADGLQGRFSTTSAKIIGELMSHKLRANGVTLRLKDIMCEIRVQWGLECLYGKAWQAKEYAERLVFDPPEESFQLLPSDVMHPTIAIDVTHLKGRFKGVLFVIVCKDANECVYPATFGIGHIEDEDSWTWFLGKLRDAIYCYATMPLQ